MRSLLFIPPRLYRPSCIHQLINHRSFRAMSSSSSSVSSVTPSSSNSSPPLYSSKYLSPDIPLPYGPLSHTTLDNFNSISGWHDDPLAVFCSWYIEAEEDYRNDQQSAEGVHWPITMQIATVNHRGFPECRTVLLKGIDNRGPIFFTNYDSAKGKSISRFPHVALNFYWKSLEKQVRIEGVAEKLSPTESDAYFHRRPIASQISAMVSNQSQPINDRADLENRYLQTVHAFAERIKQIREQQKTGQNSSGHQTLQYPSTVLHPEASGPTYDAALKIINDWEAEAAADPKSAAALQTQLVPRPEHWGGYVIRPTRIEFWCNGRYRLHSRLVYEAENEVDQIQKKALTKDISWKKFFLSP